MERKSLRRTLRFPFISPTGGIRGSASMAGPDQYGSGPRVTGTPTVNPLDPVASTFTQVGQSLVVPYSRNLRSIGIASDSAFDCCDLSIGGRPDDSNRWRISYGNPLVGDFSDMDGNDIFIVSLPTSVPLLDVGSGPSAAAFDVSPFSPTSPAGTFVGFPLRLELWYGELPPVRSPYRSPLRAYFRMQPTATVPMDMTICVSGRRKIALHAFATTATATIQVDGLMMIKSEVAGSPDTALLEPIVAAVAMAAGSTVYSLLLPTGAVTYDYIRVHLTDTATSANSHQFWLNAYDY